jgi:hypothetical protein
MLEKVENYIRILEENLEKSQQQLFGVWTDIELGMVEGRESEMERVIEDLKEIVRQEKIQ